ncbi:MAG: DUF1643 domain-containing protein [Bacteroidales bacterium]|nr:DUF1643 domain-containing protein [Bacteroidales bacterium]
MAYKVRDDFNITGFFYEFEEFSFRKFLNIKRKNSSVKHPDLMVVMMNPGSSKQTKDFENILNKEVPTIPDNTQDQIMRVMNIAKLDYARILNLSDLREPKSAILIQKFEILKEKNIYHSIFFEQRKDDFDNLFINNCPVICAWGVNPKLIELSKIAFNKVKNEKIIGLKKQTVENAFYHPLPQNNKKQKEWVDEISKIIKNTNINLQPTIRNS